MFSKMKMIMKDTENEKGWLESLREIPISLQLLIRLAVVLALIPPSYLVLFIKFYSLNTQILFFLAAHHNAVTLQCHIVLYPLLYLRSILLHPITYYSLPLNVNIVAYSDLPTCIQVYSTGPFVRLSKCTDSNELS